jgi:hypothetical protein
MERARNLRTVNSELDSKLAERLWPVLSRLAVAGAHQIWLIGSQVLGYKPDSDVDLLVIGPPRLREALAAKRRPNGWRGNFDILVNVVGERTFEEPWTRSDGRRRRKSGDLDRWKWRQISPTSADYLAAISVGETADPTWGKHPAILVFSKCDDAELRPTGFTGQHQPSSGRNRK